MGELAPFFDVAGLREQALLFLIASIVGLVGLALAFGVYTVLLRVRHEAAERRWRRLTARWEGPVLEALADPALAARVHAAVAPPEKLRFVRFALEYSRRVKGEERETLRELALPYLEPLADRALEGDVETRTRAVQTLGTLGLPRYSAQVLTALDDPSPLVGMVAARTLCQEEYPEYAGAVLRRLGRFEGWSRNFLASLMAAMGSGAAPALRETLSDDEEAPEVRAVAADALRLLSDFEAGDAAAQVVQIEEDRDLVAAALRLLTGVARPEHVTVIRVRCAAPDFYIRAAAVSALGTLAEEEDKIRLLAAMADPSPWVAIQAARALMAAGGSALLADLRDSEHPRAALAQQVLLELGDEP